jgi:autotransporter-associated beta strand protein
LTALVATQGRAGNYYWNPNAVNGGAGDAPSGTWTGGTSWSTNSSGTAQAAYTTTQNDSLYFVVNPSGTSGDQPYTVTVNGSQNAYGLWLQSSGAPTFAGTGTINLWGGGINAPQYAYGSTAQGAVTINAAVALQASQAWTNNSANTLSIGSYVTNGTNGASTLTIGGPGNTVFSGILGNGSGGLVKNGTGTLTLRGLNTFTGGTTVNGGTLDLANGGALMYSTLTVPASGIVFDQTVGNAAFTLGGLAGTGNLALQNNAASPAPVALTVGGNNSTTTYWGVLSGSGSFTKTGTGSVWLMGNNSYSGGTTVVAGTLETYPATLPNYGTSGKVTVANGATLAVCVSGSSGWTTSNVQSLLANNSSGFASGSVLGFDTSNGSFNYGLTIAGSMGVAKLTSNMLTLSGSNTYTGPTTITGGTLNLANTAALLNSTLVAPTGSAYLTFDPSIHAATFGGLSGSGSLSLQNTAAVTLTVGGNNASTVYSGALSGSGGLIKAGSAGTLTLIATNSYTGGTTIAAGTLQLGDGTSGHDGVIPATGGISNSGALVFNLYGPQTYLGAISGSGSLATIGANTLTLCGSNTFTGGTMISGGTLQLGDGTSGHDGSLAAAGGVINNGTLAFNLYGPETYSGNIIGLGSLTKAGSTLTLSGSNTFSGTTTVSGGTLTLANGNALLGSTVIAPTAGSLSFSSSVSPASFAFGALSGGGNIGLLNTNNAAVALTVGGNNATTTYSGVLSGSGSLTKAGIGAMTLTGSNTFTGGITVGAGSLIVASTGALTTASSNALYVGNTGPAAMTIQDNASVTAGELDVNYQNTSGNSSTLTLTGGSLHVINQTFIGRAALHTDPSTTSAAVYQSGGGVTLSQKATVGFNGTAASLYDISGGTLSANGGLLVGGNSGNGSNGQGNGVVNIHGSGIVNISGGQGLQIGQDTTFATSGSLSLSSGTLSVTGDVTLGSGGGLGTLTRLGGSMSVTGNLNIDGNATVVLDATTANVATTFGGTLKCVSPGTLVVVPQTGNLDTSEAISLAGTPAPTLTNGILGPWAIREASGTNSAGDYLTIAGTSSPYRLTTASYANGLSGSSGTSVVNVTGSSTLSSNTSVYAVKFGNGTLTTIGSNNTLTTNSGGMILNGGTLTGGAVAFNSNTPLVYAGGSTPSTITSTLQSSMGLTKFGPGTLVLTGANSATLSGAVAVNAGTLNVQNSGALGAGGAGSPVTVAAGAALELQNNIALGNVPVTLNGTGPSGGGSLRNVQGNNSDSGAISLGSNSQINTVGGTLTLSGPIQNTWNLTKAGTGTLVLAGSSGTQFPLLLTVAGGVLNLQNAAALGPGNLGVTLAVNSGASVQLQNGIALPNVLVSLNGAGTSGNGALENIQGSCSLAGAVTLASDSQVNVDSATDTLTLSGNVGGGFALTKGGAGTLVLSGNNSFSEALNVLSGTLSVGSVNNADTSGPLGMGTAPVGLGSSGSTGTFLYTGTASATTNRAFNLSANGGVFPVSGSLGLSGAIGGDGGLTKTGGGTLTLNGSDSYTGGTTVAAGTLAVSNSGSINGTSAIVVNQGATLQVTAGSMAQLPNSGNLTLSGGNLTYVGSGSVNPGEMAGALVLNPGQSDIALSNAGTGTTYLRFASAPVSHATGATVNYSTDANSSVQFQTNPPVLSNGIIGGYAFFSDPSVTNVDFATVSGSGPYTVQPYAGYTSGDLGSLSSNGALNVAPTGTQTSIGQSKTFNSLKLTGSTGVTINSGYSLALNSGGIIGNTTGSISGGTLSAPNGELIVNTVKHLTISSAVSASTALVKTGSDTLTLTSTTPITGNTYLNQGILDYAPTGNLSYAGVISGAANLLKTGSATLTLTGSNTYYGGTTVSGGVLSVNGALAAGSTVNVQNGAALAGSGTIGGNVVASGAAIALGPSGSIVGTVTDGSGTLTVGQAGVGNYLNTIGGVNVNGSGSLAASSTAATITGSLTYASSTSSTYSGVIVGSGQTVTLGPSAATLTLSGSNLYTGGTFLQGGTLKTANAGALGTGGLTLSGGTLDLDGLANLAVPSLAGTSGDIETSTGSSVLTVKPGSSVSTVYGGAITGSVGLALNGTGALWLSGSNSYTGGTSVISGLLIVNNSHALPSGSMLYIGPGGSVCLGDPGYSELGLLTGNMGGAGPMQSGGNMAAVGVQPLGSPSMTATPEPGTLTLLFAGLVGLGATALRKRMKGRDHG